MNILVAQQLLGYKFQTMNSIDRVDQLVKKSNMKYLEQKQHQQYQKQLEEYDKVRKKQALRSYAEIIKEGNKKAIDKAKANKTKNKNKTQPRPQPQKQDENVENKKNKLNEEERKKVQRAIEFRAQKIIQEKELDRLNKQLDEEKKKTKLFQLDEKCKKLVKSTVKLPTSKIIPEDRRKILQEFQKQAMEEIHELDHIIEGIVQGKQLHESPLKQQEQPVQRFIQLSMDHLLFTKSTDELLELDYIPI